jgi:hypothetical protein
MRVLRGPTLCSMLVMASAVTTALPAQAPQAAVTVRTFMLQRLSPQEAADLLAPYTSSAKGEGVFMAGTGVRGVTVRGDRETMLRADSLLRANDRPARTVRAHFQLISASDSALARDPAIGDVDAALRGLFRYRGYRLRSEGVAVVTEGGHFSLYLTGDDDIRLAVSGDLGGPDRATATTMAVRLVQPEGPRVAVATVLLSTVLDLQLGKTTVLGSSLLVGGGSPLVLAVRVDER